MRNTLIQALPPQASLVIQIKPPVTEDEQPYLYTTKGAGTVVVRLIDNAHAELTNLTYEIAPFVLFIGSKKISLVGETLMKLFAPPTRR